MVNLKRWLCDENYVSRLCITVMEGTIFQLEGRELGTWSRCTLTNTTVQIQTTGSQLDQWTEYFLADT